MGFIGFLFILIILFVVVIPLLRIIAAFITMKRKVASAFGGRSRADAEPAEPQRRKVYDDEIGEYVKFEEIAVDDAVEPPHGEVEYREEEQVSDVEFEEIKD